MLFRQRKTPDFWNKMRLWMWPRRSFWRSFQYFLKRMLRLSAEPHTVALGFAAGAFTSFTPFIGFHFLTCFIIAFIIRGNLIAAALGTSIGNPLTFPFIWAATFNVGNFMLGVPMREWGHFPHLKAPADYSLSSILHSLDVLWPVFQPMLVGSIPLGLAAGIFTYGITLQAVRRYQTKRKQKLAKVMQSSPLQEDKGGKAARHHNDNHQTPPDARVKR
jgi:uncharacterized protein (DUF2062 family)